MGASMLGRGVSCMRLRGTSTTSGATTVRTRNGLYLMWMAYDRKMMPTDRLVGRNARGMGGGGGGTG